MSREQLRVGSQGERQPLVSTGHGEWAAMSHKILAAFEFLFGCWHRNLSRPFTLSGWTYEVCLNCGKKFAYDRAEICTVGMQMASRMHSSDL